MENSQIHVDRRSAKTKKAIINALATLMSEKDISQITVKEISEVADINRKTFYAHYISVHDILDELENNIIAKLTNLLETIDFSTGRYDPYTIFEKLTVLIYDDFDFYKYLLQSTSYSHLMTKIKSVLKDRIIEEFMADFNLGKETLACCVEFIAAGTISAYQQWFNSDRTLSLEDIAKIVGDLAFDGMNKLIDEEA